MSVGLFGRRKAAGGLRTVAGLWLMALVSDDHAERDRLSDFLNRGEPDDWSYDEIGVWEAAGVLVVRRCLGPGGDVRQVPGFVSWLRSARAAKVPAGNKARLAGQLEMEAVIRHGLGDESVSLDGISRYDLFMTWVAAAGLPMRWGVVPPGEHRRLIAEAERMAERRGWHPPLASEVIPQDESGTAAG